MKEKEIDLLNSRIEDLCDSRDEVKESLVEIEGKLRDLSDKRGDIDPISEVFGFYYSENKRTIRHDHAYVLFKEGGAYYCERFDSVDEGDIDLSKYANHGLGHLHQHSITGKNVPIMWHHADNIKLAPLDKRVFDMEDGHTSVVQDLGDGFYYPSTTNRIWRNIVPRPSEEGMPSEEFYKLKRLYDERVNLPYMTMISSSKTKREKLRDLQMKGFIRGNVIDKYSTDRDLIKYYIKEHKEWSAKFPLNDPQWYYNRNTLKDYFKRIGVDPFLESKKLQKQSVVKSIARHIAKKAKKLKQVTKNEIEFFKMMHGASLIKNLKERKVEV